MILEIKNIYNYFKLSYFKVIFIFIISIFISFISLIQPQYVGYIISDLNKQDIAILFSFMFINLLLSSLKSYITQILAEEVAHCARKKIYNKLVYTSLDGISSSSTGDIISTISNDINLLRDTVNSNILDFVGSIVVIMGSIYFLIKINLQLFLLTIIMICIIILFNIFIAKYFKLYTLRYQESFAKFISSVEQYLSKIIIIKSFWLLDDYYNNLNKKSNDILITGKKFAKLKSIINPINNIIFQFGILLIILISGIMVSNNSMSIADLAKFILYLTMLIIPISSIANSIPFISIMIAAESRINHLYVNLNCNELEEKDTESHKLAKHNNFLEFKNIDFNYNKGKNILNNFSLRIPLNNITAILGESGIGKTTLAKLVIRLYKCSKGDIFLYGVNIADYPLNILREKIISYMPQESYDWGYTVYDSITLGKPISYDTIFYWVERLNLTNFIDSLEDGLNTKIGFVLNRSSGGELQRLAILRTILRDTDIYIFDEPTANLDSENEKLVYSILKDLSYTKSIIIITHKINVKDIANNIINL